MLRKYMNKQSTKAFVTGVVAAIASDKKMKTVAPRVQIALDRLSAHAQSENEAIVETSTVPTNDEQNQLRQLVLRISDAVPDIQFVTNTSLIAGIRLTIGDLVVDTSLGTQLTKMAQH